MFYLLLLLIKDGEGTNGERLRETPHPSRGALDTFSRLGEGFYSRALCKWRRYAAALAQPTEAFPSEGKVLNAVKRMRCSRRSGVIF